jgi:hemerythrin-like domain-containing protein/CBS domain-containing protein
LRQEHEVIEQVLSAVEMLAARIRGGATVATPPLSGVIDFLQIFVDRCHEAKEEEGLLPVLAAYGVPGVGSFAALVAEHDEGRRLVGALQLSGRWRMESEALTLLQAYFALLRRHMASEQAVLFPYAESVLSPADEVRLGRIFDQVEEGAIGTGGQEVVLALAETVMQACRAIGSASGKGAIVARDMIRTRPGVVAPEESLARAAELMGTLGIRELVVIDRGTLVGILARSDMEPYRGHYEWTAVRAAMTLDPVAVDADAPLAVVARLLIECSFNAVPVTEGERVIGMIARRDLLRVLADEDSPSPDSRPPKPTASKG